MKPTQQQSKDTENLQVMASSDERVCDVSGHLFLEKSEKCQEIPEPRETERNIGGSADAEPLESYIRPHSAFTLWQKRLIVTLGAAAGWFSTSSSFIFFPAIPFLARDLRESTERINLTVTSYLIASGVFPSIVAGLSDVYGRRPIFVVALGSYVVVNIGLALQRSFGILLGLRMLQAAAISGLYLSAL
ncbi:MFS transporter [Cordyceps javanica]|nr:MFS transporter [Cordyceps javanica]